MDLQVKLFAVYRDRVGKDTLRLYVEEGHSVAQLAERLVAAYPRVFPPASDLVVAVNQEYALPDQVLHDGDEIALIPPVSGGAR
ncbi:MAG: MoaD/ThiS family protein [Dehalococcoidia bacterium]|nr:MoaD/ThiS family protein [Dehalococcoidia bacterium]